MRLLVVRSLTLLPLCILLFAGTFSLSRSGLAYARAHQYSVASAQGVKRFWVQVMDSCQQALPGAYFAYEPNGIGVPVKVGPTPGQKPVTIADSSRCPLERGNCVHFTTGCLAFNIPEPATGTTTYIIRETRSPAMYMPCTGGSVCPGGPEVITVHINSSGVMSATVFNVFPDRATLTWPTHGAPYTGLASDPAVLHNFGIGNGSCDGDHDADDRLTGSPSAHCDSDDDD